MIRFTHNLDEVRTAIARRREMLRERIRQYGHDVILTTFHEIHSGGRYSPGTPFRTGYARASWDGGIGAVAPRAAAVTREQATVGGGAGGAEAAKERVDAALAPWAIGDSFYLWNTAPYIRLFEFGSSRRPPVAMVRRAVQNVQAIADEVATRLAGEAW